MQARRDAVVDVLEGSGAVAVVDGAPVGLITWFVDDADAQGDRAALAEVRVLALASAARGRGIGRALLASAEERLRAAGVGRVWLVTTNDNLTALALYQKAGWRLAALRPGAVDDLRLTRKPSIPEVGERGIPLRDELELAKDL